MLLELLQISHSLLEDANGIELFEALLLLLLHTMDAVLLLLVHHLHVAQLLLELIDLAVLIEELLPESAALGVAVLRLHLNFYE
jgi:hypothetical protein